MSRPSVRFGALVGGSCGLGLAAVLALVTPRGGEAPEGSALITMALGAPISLLLGTIPWFTYLSNWVVLAFVALPLNGALLGAVAGWGARAVRWESAAWLVAVPALWTGVALLITFLAGVT